MRQTLFAGSGNNRKTGKQIDFKVSTSLSDRGLESLRKNVEIEKLDLVNNRIHPYELSAFLSPFEWIETAVRFPNEYEPVIKLLAIAHSHISTFAHDLPNEAALKLVQWSLIQESKIKSSVAGDKEKPAVLSEMRRFVASFEDATNAESQLKAIKVLRSLSTYEESNRMKFILQIMAKYALYHDVRDAAKEALGKDNTE